MSKEAESNPGSPVLADTSQPQRRPSNVTNLSNPLQDGGAAEENDKPGKLYTLRSEATSSYSPITDEQFGNLLQSIGAKGYGRAAHFHLLLPSRITLTFIICPAQVKR